MEMNKELAVTDRIDFPFKAKEVAHHSGHLEKLIMQN